MSESGHSQPGMYGQGRRRRRRRGDRDAGPPGQNLSGPSRDREYQPRERRDGSEDPPGPLMQKTPIILAKPPGERAKPSQNASVSGAPVLEKPIMLMKARDDGGKPGTPPEAAAQPSGPGPSKMEKEGQRPTQPVYQIQNRGMGSSASSSAVDPMVGQSKLLPPEKMKHSIKLVDDQMNWCDSAMEYLRDQTDMLVVGVIGLQGAGKSTVMSLLSANTPEEDQRGYVFRAQTQEIKERGGNQTTSRSIQCHHMLTENRKRQRSGGDEESGHLVPQAKRQSRGHPLSPEPGRDAWDSESSNSESSSSSISSPEHAAGSCSSQCAVGPCSPLSSGDSSEFGGPTNPVSYLQINRILKHAHFQSLHSRGHLRDT